MAVTVAGNFRSTFTTNVVWSGISLAVGDWLVVVHALAAGRLTDMGGDPAATRGGWPSGSWHLLTQIDAGLDLPKLRVWAARSVDDSDRDIVLAGPSGVDNHTHLYYLSGCRDSDDPLAVFSPGAASSATAATSQAVPLYSPNASGLLVGAWVSGGGTMNYTALGGLTMETELDGSVSTSRTGEQTISASGTGSRTATASAARTWAAALLAVRADTGAAVTFPQTQLSMRAEMALGADPGADPATWAGLWTDISADVNMRDLITISRGRADESSTVSPASMTLTVNNTAGKYVRLNPLSPYYGLLNKNTPMRLWVNAGAGEDLRYTGFVSEFPPRSQGGQIDEHMPLQADGPTRRLARGRVLYSALRRAITFDGSQAAYWPLETDLASGIPGGPAMRLQGAVSFGEGGPAGSAGALEIGLSASVTVPVLGMGSTGSWQVSWWLEIPADSTDVSPIVGWLTPSSKYSEWYGYINPSNPGKVAVEVFQPGIDEAFIIGSQDIRGMGPVLVTVRAQNSGSDVHIMLFINGDPDNATDTFALSDSVTRITQFGINKLNFTGVTSMQGTVSHLLAATVDSAMTDDDLGASLDWMLTAGSGYLGETAADRITRLSTEEGVSVAVLGDSGTSEAMGPQPVASYLDVLRDCEAADGGMLYERRDARLAYQTRSARYDTTPRLTLDYSAGHVSPPLEPTDDDQHLRNDVTVSRDGGGSARVFDQDHIDTVGQYADSATVNVADDDQLPHQAGWRVHLGTADGLRFPAIAPNLNGQPGLIPDWTALDVGQPTAITSPGRDLPPGEIGLIIEGYTETLDVVTWTAEANCSPGDPWSVIVLDDDVLGRLDTDGSQLASSATTTATALSVATTSGPLWTTDETDLPVDLLIGGEQITATAIGQTLNSNPYFTVDASGWTAFNSTVARSTAQAPPTGPAGVALITPDGVNATGGINSTATGTGTITAGQSYTAVLWVYSPGGWSDIRPGIDWQTSGGSLISNAFAPQGGVPAGQWVRLTATLVAPATSSKAVVRGRHAGTPAAGNIWYAWGIRLIPAASPQQMTVTRSVNGVVKAHSSGEAVALAQPPILAQ